MNAIEFKNRFGVSKRYAEMVLSGKKVVSKKLGKRLEAATGVPRVSWCWPEDYPNPYIKRGGK